MALLIGDSLFENPLPPPILLAVVLYGTPVVALIAFAVRRIGAGGSSFGSVGATQTPTTRSTSAFARGAVPDVPVLLVAAALVIIAVL